MQGTIYGIFANTTCGLSFKTLPMYNTMLPLHMDTFLCPYLSKAAQAFMPKT